ncbi:Alpha/Beta hydrolase protein [Phlebopus sp. FC_14]|nr:Alpha/Beta hydrolase protein [Phlebopus sp. FC_14]
MILDRSHAIVRHHTLGTTFKGIEHAISTPDVPVHQFRGIKYATVPARFRQSHLCTSYPLVVDATKYGPICPQPRRKTIEECLIGLADSDIPRQIFVQDEFECLNLNITCPAGQNSEPGLPVMVWVHGGGNHGCGSSWVYDGGPLVRKSVRIGKPIVMVTFNYRLGLFGFAASPAIAEDNRAAGDEGVGNYGLRDQRRALEWIHKYIADFGGDPTNVTLFGSSSGAADIIGHLYSNANKTKPLFARAIVQSAIVEHNVPNVNAAGWQVSRTLSSLRVSSVEELRAISAETLAGICCPIRAVDDGLFFRPGWRETLFPPSETEEVHKVPHLLRLGARNLRSKSRSPHPHGRVYLPPPVSGLQPLIIGDCACDSDLWSTSTSGWAASGVVRRLRAICQCLTKATTLLNAYDIAPHTTYELSDRVLELIEDARIAWPTECVFQAAQRSGRPVWRYVFDQEGPARGIPHHAADLIYLFDNVPLPLTPGNSPISFTTDEPLPCLTSSSVSSDLSIDDVADVLGRTRTIDDIESMDAQHFECCTRCSPIGGWAQPVVDEWSYARVRDAIQSRWIAFAWGERPWDNSRGKVYVFGPEGETGERSANIFEGRRRRKIWEEVLRPLGMALVEKVGCELSNGPCAAAR